MASREEYTTCMTPYMKGAGKPKEERKADMCVGAKLCSGKASNPEEAVKLCEQAAAKAEANPKPPKAKKSSKVCTLKDLEAISICMSASINLSELTTDNMQEVFAKALENCSGAAKKLKVTNAQKQLEKLDPQQLKALETIAKLSKQFEGKIW